MAFGPAVHSSQIKTTGNALKCDLTIGGRLPKVLQLYFAKSPSNVLMSPDQIADLTLKAAQEQAWWQKTSVWVSGVGLALTAGALFFAGWQVKAAHEQIAASREAAAGEALENRKWKTLDLCNLYDANSILADSANKVHDFFESAADNRDWKSLYRPAINVLNYLDAIAIGVVAEVYDMDIVEDHMKPIIRTQVPRLLLDADARKIGIPEQDFACLIKVYYELLRPKLSFKESKAERL
jgi:hypothetical protein